MKNMYRRIIEFNNLVQILIFDTASFPFKIDFKANAKEEMLIFKLII